MRRLVSLGIVFFIAGASARADSAIYTDMPSDAVRQLDDRQIDADFVCPETLSAERKVKELINFMSWAKSRHADWSTNVILDFRYSLFVRHQCTETLRNIQRSQEQAK